MRRPAALLALLVSIAIANAGCLSSPPGFVSDWEDERAVHGPVGIPSTFEATADAHHIKGEGRLDTMVAPFDLVVKTPFAADAPHVFFVGGVAGVGTGIVGLVGADIAVTAGSVSDAPIAKVTVTDGIGIGFKEATDPITPIPVWPSWAEDASSAYFFSEATRLSATGILIEEADRAFLLNGTGEATLTNLTFPLTIDAEAIVWEAGSLLRTDAATVALDRFGWAAEATEARLVPEGQKAVDRPIGVFGNDGVFRLTPNHVASVGTFRLTQALTDDGLLLDAEVELRLDDDTTEVAAGGPGWVMVRYREKGYTGSAVLEDVSVTGPGAPHVRVPLDDPPLLVEELWDTVSEAGWAGAFVAIPLAVASPFILLAEGLATMFDCLLNDCPSQHPYPVWMEPGEIGRFYFLFDATDVPPGEYDVRLTFEGQNHDPVPLDATITVR